MNAIEQLERAITTQLPDTWTRLRRPRNPQGMWWLDANRNDHLVTIQWSTEQGFGVSASLFGDGYGEGPEEVYSDASDATTRVLTLLQHAQSTLPPREVAMRELRSQLGLTQVEVAARMGVQQAAVSRFERRGDFTLSSLRRYVNALGAELEINVKTSTGECVRLASPELEPSSKACCHHVSITPSDRPPAAGRVDAQEMLVRWLAHGERDCRRRWELRSTSMSIVDKPLHGDSLSMVRGREIVIDWNAATRFAASLAGLAHLEAAAAVELVVRHLIGHELGHCLNARAVRSDPVLSTLGSDELVADVVAGWLCAPLAPKELGAELLGRLGCERQTCIHPAPGPRRLAYLVGHAERTARHNGASTSLLVLRSTDLEQSRRFYEALGLVFVREKHGNGPQHYACELGGGMIFELYPAGSHPVGGVRLGLRLSDAERALSGLSALGPSQRPPTRVSRPDGPVWVVRDPDGNAVEISAHTVSGAPISARRVA